MVHALRVNLRNQHDGCQAFSRGVASSWASHVKTVSAGLIVAVIVTNAHFLKELGSSTRELGCT